MFPPFASSKILVHIAFHFVEERLKYLEAVIANLQGYGFLQIDIVIDTNSAEAMSRVGFEKTHRNSSITFRVHSDLPNPYLLTWEHRSNMSELVDGYDYFMYLEDDIFVPFEALRRWRSDSCFLYPRGYLRGFLRVEKDRNGGLVCVDQHKRARIRNLVSIEGTLYYAPHVPYQAFWICDHQQMMDFMSSPAWKNSKSDWCIRERAASGMTLLLRKNHKNQKHNLLIPLDENGKIPKEVLVRHLPNNYADNPNVLASKLGVDKLMDLGILTKAYKAYLKSSAPSGN